MKIWCLPTSILLAILAHPASGLTVSSAPTPTRTSNGTRNGTIASSGDGPSYAHACWSAQSSYSSAYTSWSSAHQWLSTTILTYGPTSWDEVTYYENATTLCDGHPRVTYSPAISRSEGNITYTGLAVSTDTIVGTYFSNYDVPEPSCSIKPKDCDPLWAEYSKSVGASDSQITAPPIITPGCTNSSQASINSEASAEIYGCGPCTIFGNNVQLVFFPTTASRDMCASTPTANLTHYGPGAVITAYAGKSYRGDGDSGNNQTVVADGHTFTSGTAYISIGTVYAVDRCSKTFGSPVKDAVLAMPSESVLSLRYSQDHFQRLMQTDRITGYPVSYADFNSPVPWSAWAGMNLCDPGGFGGWACSIVYENQFRPQLAIPPEITRLSPEFEGCQMWYNGLWDPPLALHQQTAADTPQLPPGYATTTSGSAAPSATPASPTAPATALPDQRPTRSSRPNELPGPTLPVSGSAPYSPNDEPWVQSFQAVGHTLWATGANGQVHIEGVTLTSSGPTRTLPDGVLASYGSDGVVLRGSSTVTFGDSSGDVAHTRPNLTAGAGAAINSGLSGPGSDSQNIGTETSTITVNGDVHTVMQGQTVGVVVFDGSTTLTPGADAVTMDSGEVLSAASNGLVVGWSTTLGQSNTAFPSPSGSTPGTRQASSTTSTSTDVDAQTATNTASADIPKETGSSSKMSSSQALSLFAALIALTVAIGI